MIQVLLCMIASQRDRTKMADEVAGFDVREKLKILRSMIPDYKRYLVPSKIISDLEPHVLDEDQVRQILETERRSRSDAVEMLMNAVIEKKEEGLNFFIYALEQENDNTSLRWERFLNPLENAPTQEAGNHPGVNKYLSLVIRCIKGDIIRLLTPGELRVIVRELYSQKVIDKEDMEDLARLNHREKFVNLFRMLPRVTPEWPLKFFHAVNHAKPEILGKIDPLIELDRETVAVSDGQTKLKTAATADSEQTAPKRSRTSSDEDTSMQDRSLFGGEDSEEVSMDVEYDLLDSDEESLEFSDSEEKYQDTEKSTQPESFSMRKYQYELATPALTGQNTIICAPTGSGKTRVALYIVKQHLEIHGSRNRKVVFLARTVPLVSQQFNIFQKYLPDFRCTLVHGETADHEALHLMLDEFDILVLTPKILENHLAENKIQSLSVFSLIIFDECHHTRKGEPYNSVMKHYLKFKKAEAKDLPQIVGLTASIGVEKATTVEKAEESIIAIMANLDVKSITVVREHLDEMDLTVPKPDERLEELTPREDDEVSKSIIKNMVQVEHLLGEQIPTHYIDPEFLVVNTILRKRPAQRNSQKYGQWAVKMCDVARKVHIPEQPDEQLSAEVIERRRVFSQNVQLLAEALIAFNEALDVHELTRPVDVLEHLKRKLDPRHTADSSKPTWLEVALSNLLEGMQKKLRKEATAKNPNLSKLSEVIVERMEGQWDTSRVMVFVRTRAACEALCSWLNTDSVISPLRNLKASPFTGTGAHQEHGGMTQHEQEGVIEKFRDGDVKLLVCTTVGQEGMDIPDCNLVIRYNHVGNEVATVQTRGRSRKAGGVSVLLAMPAIIRKERINKKRVQIMNQAIKKINQRSSKETKNQVLKAQQQAMDKDEMKKIASMKSKKSRMKQGSFTMACARCRKVCVPGSSIRTINSSHHVVIGNDLLDNQDVSIKIRGKPKVVDNVQFIGEIMCNRCPVTKQNLLGNTLKFQEAEFLALKAESWLVLGKNNAVEKCGKWKWKDMGYPIPELTPSDMSAHLGLPPDYEDEEGAVGGTSD